MALQKFPRIYNKANFGVTSATKITLTPNQYNTIGTVTVPSAQQITFGIGGVGQGVDTREVCYIRSDSTAASEMTGTYRLVLSDPNGIRQVVVAEQRSERSSASATDRTLGWLLGEYPIKAQKDSLLLIQFKTDSGNNEVFDGSDADTKFLIPVTVYQ